MDPRHAFLKYIRTGHNPWKGASGSAVRADAVILAVGSQPRDLPYGIAGEPAYFHQPYPVLALASRIGRRVGIVGCRHSAIDVALALLEEDASRKVIMASRRSRPPRPTDAYQRLPLRTTNTEEFVRDILDAGGGLKSAVRIVNRELRAWGIEQSLVQLMAARTAALDSSSISLIYGMISSMNNALAEIWNVMPEAQRNDFQSRWQSLWSDFRVPPAKDQRGRGSRTF